MRKGKTWMFYLFFSFHSFIECLPLHKEQWYLLLDFHVQTFIKFSNLYINRLAFISIHNDKSRHSRHSFRPSSSTKYFVSLCSNLQISRRVLKYNIIQGWNLNRCIVSTTYLYSFTATTLWSRIIFVRRAVLLHPERMCSILNKPSRICGNLIYRNNEGYAELIKYNHQQINYILRSSLS